MKKFVVPSVLVVICSFGAYFLGSTIAEGRVTPAPLPKKEVILSEIEARYAENPENIFEIVAETRSLLAGNTKTQSEIARARIRLDRAVDAFYKKHLDTVALGLVSKNGLEKYQKSYETLALEDPKLGLGIKNRLSLRENLLKENTINPTGTQFEAYTYLIGKAGTGALTATGVTQSGSLSKETMQLMVRAEKGQFAGTGVVLPKSDVRDIFGKYSLRPWSQ